MYYCRLCPRMSKRAFYRWWCRLLIHQFIPTPDPLERMTLSCLLLVASVLIDSPLNMTAEGHTCSKDSSDFPLPFIALIGIPPKICLLILFGAVSDVATRWRNVSSEKLIQTITSPDENLRNIFSSEKDIPPISVTDIKWRNLYSRKFPPPSPRLPCEKVILHR